MENFLPLSNGFRNILMQLRLPDEKRVILLQVPPSPFITWEVIQYNKKYVFSSSIFGVMDRYIMPRHSLLVVVAPSNLIPPKYLISPLPIVTTNGISALQRLHLVRLSCDLYKDYIIIKTLLSQNFILSMTHILWRRFNLYYCCLAGTL